MSGMLAYIQNHAAINKVSETAVASGQEFNVYADVSVNFVNRVRNSDPLLSKMDIATCEEIVIKDFDYVRPGLISRTTKTEGGALKRVPTSIGGTSDFEYNLREIDFDILLERKHLVRWNKKHRKQFLEFMRDLRVNAKRHDLYNIGWHGKEWKETSDPLLAGADVNVGWLEYIRQNAPAHVLADDGSGGPLTIGKDGVYLKVDSLVNDMLFDISPEYKNDLMVLISNDLLGSRQRAQIDGAGSKELGEIPYGNFHVAGLPAIVPPMFPEGTILLIDPFNLAHRTQEDTVSQQIINDPNARGTIHYQSAYETYGISDYMGVRMAEKITLKA